jgi:hypothetical protein
MNERTELDEEKTNGVFDEEIRLNFDTKIKKLFSLLCKEKDYG